MRIKINVLIAIFFIWSVGDLPKVTEWSNKYSVSSSDLATAIPKVSATLAQAGNSMSESIALITSGSEVMIRAEL